MVGDAGDVPDGGGGAGQGVGAVLTPPPRQTGWGETHLVGPQHTGLVPGTGGHRFCTVGVEQAVLGPTPYL